MTATMSWELDREHEECRGAPQDDTSAMADLAGLQAAQEAVPQAVAAEAAPTA